MRKLSTLRVFSAACALSLASMLSAQTVVFSDDFSTDQSATFTTSGAIGASAWSITRNAADWGGRRNTTPAQLELTNDASGTTNVNGWVLASTPSSSFLSPYNTTLSSNPGLVSWTFNIRQIRPDPAGYAVGAYAAAYVIAGTAATSATAGAGYAIVYGQSGATDPIRLVHYTTGLQGTLSNLITSNTTGLTDFGAEYISVRVTYTPSTNTWELFLRNDGASAFADPTTGTLVSQGTVVNSTYTGTSLALMGAYWQGSTTATQTAFFDNARVAVTTAVTNTSVAFAAASSSVSEAAAPTDLTINITDPDAVNATNVTITATGATGRITTFTTPVIAAGAATTGTCTVTLNNNLICDANENVTFTITGVSGGQGTPTIGAQATHVLTVNNDDLCTSVQFLSATASGTEGGGTVALTLGITNPDATNATTVDVALTAGDAADVNSYATQTVTFPAGSSANETVTITITNDLLCEGAESLTFTAQNIAGGQGTPFIGAQATTVLTIGDNDSFTATVSDDFEDGNFLGWNEGTAGHWLVSSSLPPGGTQALRHATLGVAGTSYINKNIGAIDLATTAASWSFQLRYNNDPSTNNKFWFWLAANEANLTSATVDGYAVGVNLTGSNDLLTLWKVQNGINGTVTALVTSTYDFGANNLVGINVTRTAAGGWELNFDANGGFDALVSAGTASDATYTTVGHIGLHHVYSASLTGLLRFDDISFTSDRCEATYYSQSTGNVGDAIWALTPVGTPGAVNFTNADNVVIQNGHVVTVDNSTLVRNSTVQTGGTLALNATTTYSVSGDEAIFDGTLTAADNSTLALVGSEATILESTGGTLNLFDLTVNTPNGTLTDATIAMRGTLSLQDGVFDASLGNVTLISTAAGTARLGPVGAGASYTGTNFTVQRYIPAGNTNWRFLGSPVAGRTIFHWKDDFFTAGFPGSHYPEFFDPPGSGIYWPSIRDYNETVANASPNVGLLGVEGLSTPLTSGKGFAAWSGDTDEGTAGFVIDLTGTPFVANTPITLPMTWTDSGNPLADGWNLVSNPVASPIDFTAISRGANVANQYYIFDPALGNNRAWTNGVSSGGANGIIQSSQGFWLKATGSAVTTTVSEDDKVLASSGGVFGGDQQSTLPMLRINLTNDQNSYGDESIVVFAQGTPGLDAIDATKLVFAHPQAPQVTTRSSEGTDLAIDFHGAYTTAISIPVTVRAAVAGTYTITTNLSGISTLSCLSIEDLVTGTVTPLTDGAAYSFTQAVTEAPVARFIIRGSAPIAFSAVDATCGGADNGQATVEITNGPVDVTWTDGFGSVLLQQTGVAAGTTTFAGLAPGNYMVRVSSNEACGELVSEFSITAPFVLEAAIEEQRTTSCPNTNDGLLDMLALGGTAPYTYAWSNGATTEDLTAGAGDHSLTVTDANGCVWTSDILSIEAGVGPVAGIEAVATTVVNTPVTFTSTTEVAETWSWSFGDGATSTDENPTHTYVLPGTYEVTLVATYGDCSDATTFNVTVELSTGVAAVSTAQPVRAWMSEAHLLVEHPYTGVVNVELMDATGRLHAERSVNSGAGRIMLPSSNLTTGIWFVRVTHAGEQQTLRVPLVR